MSEGRSPVSRAVDEALRAAAPAFDARGILVVTDLAAQAPELVGQQAAHEAIATLFRALPDRLPPGCVLYASTRDVPGGVELSFEAREAPSPVDAPVREILRRGPHGDLLELALRGLEALCGARHSQEAAPEPASGGLTGLRLEPGVRRRYAFLLPTPRERAAAEA